MADETTSAGPIVSVVAGEADLRALVNSLKDQMAEARATVAQGNAQIAAERSRFLQAQTADEKQAYREQIAALQAKNAEVRASVADTQAEVQRLSRNLPKIPIKVEVEGAKEAFATIREELGVLLGPLNGVTSRITALGSLLKELGKSALEGGEEAAGAAEKGGKAAEGAVASVAKLATQYSGMSKTAKEAEGSIGDSSKQLNLFANTISGRVGDQLNLFSNEVDKGVAGEAAFGAAAGEAATESEGLAGSLGALAAPILLVGTALAVTVGSLFEAGKGIAELAEKNELLGLRIGLSANQMSNLGFAAQATGVPIETLVNGIARLGVRLSGGGRGGGGGGSSLDETTTRARQTLELFIGSVQESSGKMQSPITTLEKLADVFKAMPDQAGKGALAIQLFGLEGDRLVPFLNKGAAGIQELLAQAEKFGINLEGQAEKMSAYNLAIQKVTGAWTQFLNVLANVGVFDLVTKGLTKVAEAVSKVAEVVDGGRTKIAEGIQEAFSADLTKQGRQLTEQGAELSKKLSDAFIGTLSNTFNGPQIHTLSSLTDSLDFLPPDKQKEIISGIRQIQQATAGVEDQKERAKIFAEQYAALESKLTSEGVLQLKTTKEITEESEKAANAQAKLAFVQSGGVQALDQFSKEVDKMNEELVTADQNFGVLGGSGDKLKGNQQDVDALRSKLQGLVGSLRGAGSAAASLAKQGVAKASIEDLEKIRQSLPAYQRQLSETRSVLQQLVQVEEQVAAKAQQLPKEFEKISEEAADAAAKNLGAADQVQFYTQKVEALTTAQKNYAEELVHGITDINARADAQKKLTDAQLENERATEAARANDEDYNTQRQANQSRQAQLRDEIAGTTEGSQQQNVAKQALAQSEDELRQLEQAHKLAQDDLNASILRSVEAYQAALKAVIALLPNDVHLQEVQDKSIATLQQLKTATEAMTQARSKLTQETDKNAQESAKLGDESARLNTEIQKVSQQTEQVGEKQLTLGQQVARTQADIKNYSDKIFELNIRLSQLKDQGLQGTNQYLEAQRELLAQEQGRLEAEKRLGEEQKELSKDSLDLKKAMSEFNEVLEGLGVTLPKPITKIVAMIDAMEKLFKLIQQINATRGVNIPVVGGSNAPGTTSTQGGFGGILKQFGSIFGGKKQGIANLDQSEGDNGDSDGGLAGSLSGGDSDGGGGLDDVNFAGVAASAGVGAGIGGAIADATGGNSTVGSIGGGVTGAGLSLLAVNPIIGGVVAGVGAVITIIGALLGNTAKQAQKIAKEIANFTQSTVTAVQASDETLVQGLTTLQGQRTQAIQQLSSKGSKGNEQLAQLLPQIDQQIEQLKGQSQQIQINFAQAFETSQLPQALQSYGDQIQQLNKQVQDYVNAGGSAAVATQFLVNQLNSMKVAIGSSLLQSEQQAISLLQQEIQLQVQKGQLIQQESQQEADILNQGVVSRQRSQAQTQAQQILALRQQRDQQLTNINQQIAQTQAQLGNQAQIFGLTLNQNALLQTQLSIQQQITAQSDQQIENLQQLQQYLPTSPTSVSPTGAPQIPVPTSTLTPGQAQGPLPGSVPINSTAFLNILLGTGDYGRKVLTNLFGSVPNTLTSDQMQQVITALQTGNSQGRNLIPQLTAALTAAQSTQYTYNPSLNSSLQNIPTPVTSAQANAGGTGGIDLGNGIVIPTSAISAGSTTSTGSPALSSGSATVQIAAADTVTIGSGSGAVNLSDLAQSASSTNSAATALQTAATSVTKAFTATPGSVTVSSGGSVSPTSSPIGSTVPFINQAQLAALEPNVPSAQAGLPPPVLGLNEVTSAGQLAGAQFTAPFLPIVQAVGNLISIGSNAALLSARATAPNVPAKFNPNPVQFSGAPASVTVNINGTANMSKNDLKKAVTDGMLGAYDSLRARRGTTSLGN